jgi:uncharacterized Rmd1/YagE family protein
MPYRPKDGVPTVSSAGDSVRSIREPDTTPTRLSAVPGQPLRAVAYFIGERIDVRALGADAVANGPVVLREGTGGGLAAVFRYGAVVLFDLWADEEARFLRSLAPHVVAPFPEPASEEALLQVAPGESERVAADGTVRVHDVSVERLQIVAHVLAKSAVLGHYEQGVERILDRIEPFAARLRRGGNSRVSSRAILQEIGEVLLTQTRTVGRVEVAEQPEMTWEEPELERLYTRLSAEYDLRDRDSILERKLLLCSRIAETLLDLLQNRRALRVEWYIVGLIVVEIVLLCWDLFIKL